MSDHEPQVETLFAHFVEEHVIHGRVLAPADLCGAHVDLIEPLARLIDRYQSITYALDGDQAAERIVAARDTLPQFEGFQTIERLGGGGMGEVFKLRDLMLNRIVAGKVIRRDPAAPTGIGEFLREARSMALFADRRIVRIFEFRPDADPPVIIMEHVDGFELGRIGPSLEFAQRARVLIDICGALEHAHALGLQHRDLKPSNIMVDAAVRSSFSCAACPCCPISACDRGSRTAAGTCWHCTPSRSLPSMPASAPTRSESSGHGSRGPPT